MRNILAVLILLVMVSTVGAGGYSYYVISKDRAKIAQKDKEIERLTQSAGFLSKKLAEVEETRAKFEEEAATLRYDAQKFENEKRVILEQVRTAVDNFDVFRRESGSEMDRLRRSVAELEAQKNELSRKMESTLNLSREEKENLAAQVSDLSKKIDTQKEGMATLLSQVENLQRSPLADNAFKMHYNLGNYYFRQRQYKAAAAEYKQALAYLPDDAEAHFNLALVSEQHLGDNDTAIAHYKKYLALHSGAADAADVRERLLDLEMGKRIMDEKIRPAAPMDMFEMAEDK